MSHRRAAFLTLDDRSEFVIDDALAIDALVRDGWSIEEVPWRRANVAWNAFDVVVIRTPWDYTQRLDEFLSVLAGIDTQGVPLANPLDVVRWNARKTYLRDLAARDVPIVPTTWGDGLDAITLRTLRDAHADAFVIKPVVGANAFDTFVVKTDDDDHALERVSARYPRERGWMAQPFVQSIVDRGEFSVFYFDGEYSHAISKTPKRGDFRVQEEHGGIIRSIEPTTELRAAADRVLAAIGRPLLQARIDMVRLADESLALMEAELIEPSLYFRTHPDAPVAFARALARWLDRHRARGA